MLGWEGWAASIITLSVLILLITSKIAPHLILMGALVMLSVSGILTPEETLIGFSNSGLITVAAMFIVAAGIQASGGVDWLVNRVMGKPASVPGAMVRLFLPVTSLSAFLNNTPVVATMIPAVNAWCKKINVSPSKLMIPLSYASILGGTLTLIGTSTNLVVNGQYQQLTGSPGFSLFAITAVGLPAAAVGLLFLYLFGPKLLPDSKRESPFDNIREFTFALVVEANGPLVGKSIKQAGLRELKRLFLVEITRGERTLPAVASDEVLQPNDVLIFAGATDAIADVLNIAGLKSTPISDEMAGSANLQRLVEVVVSPHCAAVGSALREVNFRKLYGAAVVAVARNAERVSGNLGDTVLAPGDTLLLDARPSFIARQQYSKDFLLIHEIPFEKMHHEKAPLAWGILIVAVVAAGLTIISMLNAALLAAAAMLLTRCLSPAQAERSLDLPVIITIAASFALGMALQQTGVALVLANQIVAFSAGEALLLLILTYITVSLLTEIITNNAAALLMMPIVIEITNSAALNPIPFVFAIMMAASASFATPIGYQTNLMVYGPGNYRFSDFLKIGIPMNILVGAVTVVTLVCLYPLTA
ncbi:SLC13 family permease [Alteromonas ponticola]|uniref:SLC13 family permease n=1 Tax=Alteromonas aquimaris TaxID=2998417 RepID=A0ABT3P9V5_9ALTE|nr:SLC13 family permease [Alteromonas aquimaris]MCW8109544.1 SLC13 family permease [Alteromonas aquimaris]